MSLSDHAQALRASLEKANLVPGSAEGLIPADFTPKTKLYVAFHDKEVNMGNLLRVTDVKLAPSILFEHEVRAIYDDLFFILRTTFICVAVCYCSYLV